MLVAVREKKLLLIKDFAAWPPKIDQDIPRPFMQNYRSNSCIISPLLSGDTVIGILNLADKLDEPVFDQSADLPPVQLLCDIIGSAMANINFYEEVRKRARTDSMTELLNHRSFYNELDREVSRVRRYGGSLSLIMVDLDELKTINDLHGHRAGDAALVHVAEQIRYCIRGTDSAARYGGDEFAVILPNTSLVDATIVAERLVSLVATKPIEFGEHNLRISVSVGLGEHKRDASVEDLMNNTDKALMTAKNSGKNQVHVLGAAT